MGFGRRPTGVTVLAILAIMMVLACALAAIVFLMLNSMLANEEFVQSLINNYGITQRMIDDLMGLALPYGIVTTAYAVIFTLLAYSLLKGARWGWGLGVAFAILLMAYAIVMFVLSPSISNVLSLVIQLLIQVLILFYLNTVSVVAWFKGPAGRGLWGPKAPARGQY